MMKCLVVAVANVGLACLTAKFFLEKMRLPGCFLGVQENSTGAYRGQHGVLAGEKYPLSD